MQLALALHGLILYPLTFMESLSLGQQSKSTEQKKGTIPCESQFSIVPSMTLGSKQTSKPHSQNWVNCSQKELDFNLKFPFKGFLL